MERRIHGIKWLLMGIALIAFAIPYSFVQDDPGTIIGSILVGISVFSPCVGLVFCIYGFLKRD